MPGQLQLLRQRRNEPGRPRLQGWLGSIMLGASLVLAACDDPNADRAAMDMVQYLPLAVVVPKGEQMRHAEEYVRNRPHFFALWAVSPRPLPGYGDRAGLVVEEVDFSALQRGMTVVYLNDLGAQLGGLLVRPEEEGWVVKDWGAGVTKTRLVTPRTLVGVVRLAFVAPEPPVEAELLAPPPH